MTSETKRQRKWGRSFFPAAVLFTLLCLSGPALGQVDILGSWETGTSHPNEPGTDRALLFIAHGEMNGTMNLASATYGGRPMTKVVERDYHSTIDAYVAVFILDETGLAAATNETFNPTWDTDPTEIKYSSVFLSGVNQADLTGDSDTAGGTSATISTSSLATDDGDMVIGAATCGNSGSYTFNNGFTLGINISSASSTGAAGYKSATGSNETPSVTHNSANRQALIGFVVQAEPPDSNKATNPDPVSGASDVPVSAGLSWDAPAAYTPTSYDVYLGTNPTVHSNPKNTVYTNSYNPPDDLEFETTYYWAVDSNDSGTIYPGDLWSFTTIKNNATDPDPGDGQKDVSITTTLSWTDAASATSYDVYFGTNPAAHSNPKHTVYTNSYDPPGDLEFGTIYYWAVDPNDDGTIYPGDEWSFTTAYPYVAKDRVVGNMMLINDNGGWCWYQDEKIIYDPVGGNILTSTAAQGLGFGGVSGTRLNDMDATTFNIATGHRTRALMRDGGGDDHNMGAFWIRPDGRYLHLYCPHYTDHRTFYRLATNPNDGSAWGSEQYYNWLTIPGSPGSDTISNSSYTNIVYLTGQGTGQGRLYNIHRVFTRTPCIAYSDDWGQNWTYMGRLNDVTISGYSNFYHKFAGNGVDRIDFIGCEAHPRDYDDNSIYHGYIQGGISYDSYGNQVDVINDQNAPAVGAFTPIWLSEPVAADSYHTGWTNELELDDQNYPVCLFQTRYGIDSFGGEAGAADHRFFYARFDGSTWNITELAKMGTGLHSPEQDYIGMGCIHPDDANLIYISTPFDPRDDSPLSHHEIFKGVTDDYGATWNWTQITIDSTEDNIRPAIPKWDKDNTAVFWARGEYPGQEQYDFVIVGMVDEEGKTLGLTTYIDANETNTEESDGSAFTPTGPSGSAGAADNQWHEYTGYGNGGSCYTAGDGGTENAPTIRTTVSGLSDGTYDVFAYFWCDPDLDWGVRGGFTSSDMLCFNKQSSQHADASEFSGSVNVVSGDYELYRVYIGRKEISGGSSVTVYIDNYDSSYNSNAPTRTTYDGIGVAPVVTGPVYNPGDLNQDGRVDLVDIAKLGQGWQTVYSASTLADVAANWLFGI